MSPKLPIAGALLCASFLAGCAPAMHRPLVADRNAVQSTEVIESVKQAEVYAQINVSNVTAAMGGGLLAALIDTSVNSSRASDAEAAIRPLRDALTGFDFDETLKQDLSRELGTVQWLGARPISINKNVTDKAHDEMLAKSDAGGMMFVTADYSLSPDFSTLRVSAITSLFARSPEFQAAAAKAGVKKPAGKGVQTMLTNATYYNTITVETKLPGAGTTLEANRDVWGANSGDKLRRALQGSTQQLAKLITMDLEYKAPAKGAKPTGEIYNEGMLQGRVVQQGPEGKLVRFNNGTVKYLAVLQDPAVAAQPAAGTQ